MNSIDTSETASILDLDGRVKAFSLAGIFFLMMLAFLYFTRTLMAPVLAALFNNMIFAPVVSRCERWGVPPSITAISCVSLVIALLNGGIYVLGDAISRWASHTTKITEAFKTKAYLLDRPFVAWRELQQAVAHLLGTHVDPPTIQFPLNAILERIVEFLSPAIGELVIFFGCLYFFLITKQAQRRFLVQSFNAFQKKLVALKIINEIERCIPRYFFSVTVVNIAVGLVTAALAYLCGLPNFTLLGTITFALNYIPYIGPAVTALILFVVGVLTLPELGGATVAPVLFIGLAIFEGHFLTPSIIGRQMTISPLAMFLSLAFWTWMWGPIGTFLAMPLVISLSIVYAYALPDDTVDLPG
jgi:predicted PurR-regulated permease PerM